MSELMDSALEASARELCKALKLDPDEGCDRDGNALPPVVPLGTEAFIRWQIMAKEMCEHELLHLAMYRAHRWDWLKLPMGQPETLPSVFGLPKKGDKDADQ